MRILLDNCIPADLAPHIRGHDVFTAVDMGWAALDDASLLNVMAGQFDVLLTVDKRGILQLWHLDDEVCETLPHVQIDGHLVTKYNAIMGIPGGFVLDGESDILANADDPLTASVFDASIRGRTSQFAYKFRKPKT